MESKDDLAIQAFKNISQSFSLDMQGIPDGGKHFYDQLKLKLSTRIAKMMDHHLEQLINSLYRLDIDENKVNEVFSSQRANQVPKLLAELIIERQIQKVISKRQHRKGNQPEDYLDLKE